MNVLYVMNKSESFYMQKVSILYAESYHFICAESYHFTYVQKALHAEVSILHTES